MTAIQLADFPKLAGEPDDTARLQRAIDKFLLAAPANLDLGTSNLLISDTLKVYRPDNSPVFGSIHGDGPGAFTIRSYPGKCAMRVQNGNYLEISGIKFSGGPAYTTSLDHAGLVVGNLGGGVSHACKLSNLQFEHYGVGLSLGDYVTAGAAAEINCENIGAGGCHIGIAGFGSNTLNNTFTNTELGECDMGVYSDSAYGWTFNGGSSANNRRTFHLVCGGAVDISGWREETSSRSSLVGGFVTYGASTSIRLSVRGCSVQDTPGRQLIECIHEYGGETSLDVLNCTLNGAVSARKYVSIRGTAFAIPAAARCYVGTPTLAEVRGCTRIDLHTGQTLADLPRV